MTLQIDRDFEAGYNQVVIERHHFKKTIKRILALAYEIPADSEVRAARLQQINEICREIVGQ